MGKQIALVTGGSRGLGRAIAMELACRGWHVVVNYKRNGREAEATLRRIGEAGGTAELYQADVQEPAQVERMFKGVLRTHRRLDLLVNNAGITRDGYFLMMEPADWDQVLATDFSGAFRCCRMAAAIMAVARHGVIINIGSSSALSARPGQVNYGTAKAGLLGLSRSLARELAPKGIRVLTVAPGLIATDMAGAVPSDVVQATVARIPLGRWGEPADIARAVAFFASADGHSFSGQVIVADGGRTALELEYGLAALEEAGGSG
jgi:3-oxoacyl-[acyl-carrier protein] reductase